MQTKQYNFLHFFIRSKLTERDNHLLPATQNEKINWREVGKTLLPNKQKIFQLQTKTFSNDFLWILDICRQCIVYTTNLAKIPFSKQPNVAFSSC